MLIHGDCLERMQTLLDGSVDSIVTDPPYGLAFMGKKWDYDVPAVEVWAECLRVLKPGGHLLAFAGTRTQHRMAVRIEDVGFEIRDMIAWVYGSGFPKSLDVSKAIDKANGRRFEDRYALGRHIRKRREASGFTRAQVNAWFGYADGCEHWERQDRHGARVPTLADWRILRDRLGLSDEWSALVERAEAEREVVGVRDVPKGHAFAGSTYGNDSSNAEYRDTAPATDAARQWSGWGTALKPAMEPITVARKPLCGTVAENVLRHGTGGINVDGCRVGTESTVRARGDSVTSAGWASVNRSPVGGSESGRWPANLIHDGSDEVVGLFPQTAKSAETGGIRRTALGRMNDDAWQPKETVMPGYGDSGSAARFFYCAKASKADREAGCEGLEFRTAGEMVDRKEGSAGIQNPRAGAGRTGGGRNGHPTVKPCALMRYLCRLVTPPGGIVLDPFMGSGSTGKAAIIEGFRFIGIEREAEYVEIARARIQHAKEQTMEAKDTPHQMQLEAAHA